MEILLWAYFEDLTLSEHLGGLLWVHFWNLHPGNILWVLTMGIFWASYSGYILGVLHSGNIFWCFTLGTFWGSFSGYILHFCFCFITAPLGEFQIKSITVTTSDNINYKRQVSGNSKPWLKLATSQETQQLHIMLTMLGESLKPTAIQDEVSPSI